MLDDLLHDPDGPDESARPRRAASRRARARLLAGRQPRRTLAIGAVALLIGLLAQALLRNFVLAPMQMDSHAMEPLVRSGSVVLVSVTDEPQRGEVIVFDTPSDWTADPDSPGVAIRMLRWFGVLHPPSKAISMSRVIGVPGDELVCCTDAGDLVVNGASVPWATAEVAPRFRVVVPRGAYFVRGDNPGRSTDSRCFVHSLGAGALVGADRIRGTAGSAVWPVGAWGAIGSLASYTGVPEPGPAPDQATVEAGKDEPC